MPHSSRSSRTAGPLRALLIAALVGVVFAAGLFIYRGVGGNSSADYKGQGEETVVVHVEEGEGLDGVATTLEEEDVVKSSGAFTTAAMNNPVAEGLQPGYYELRKKMKASVAVAMLADPNARVGMLQVPAGARLNDTTVIGGPGATGIYQAISEASCLRTASDSGEPQCVSAEEFKKVASESDPAELGVPEWAINEVRGGPDPTRRLEGLISAGNHDFDPSLSPAEILRELVSTSAQQYEQSGLLQSAGALKLSPYQLVTAASLIQHEAGAADFGKVATVILNRLAKPMPLQFDSTVNYTQTDQEVATTDDARNQDNPWNTYAHDGLPYGPIASPSMEAITAMEHPEPGDWLYFVTVSDNGDTKFTSNYDEHLANQQEAVDSGVLATGR